jgi:flagellar motility protein MotE (MotC chaperone)
MDALRSSPVSDAELSLEILRRERAVEDREAALAERESVLAALEARLQEQVQALETAEAELSATMALADRAAEDDIQRLVGVFEVMKAEDAAAVFAEMDPGFAAGFLSRLPAEIAAEILANLEPRQAYGLSALIAGRNALVPRD